MTGARIERTGAVCAALLAIVFVATAVYFARLQNVWIDESTQLSGAMLPPARMMAWLAGGPGPAIAVPSDRTPPVSYLLDAACGATLCSTPLHFRLLQLVVVTLAAGALLLSIAQRLGGWAVAASAAVLFLSPKLVEYGVEIRAYPVFFALTCGQVVLLTGLIDDAWLRAGRVLMFAGLGLLVIYTHFFGLVSTMALFGGLFAARARGWRDAALVAGTAAVVLVLSAGLQPFVAGANAISQTPVATADTNSVPQFVLKLIGQSSTLLSLPVALAFFASFAVMLAVAFARAAWVRPHDDWRAPGTATFAIIVALALGLFVTLIASRLVQGFDALKPTYSIWMLPLLAWLAGAACAPLSADTAGRHALVLLARGAAVVFAVAAFMAQSLFVTHAAWFVHGPGSAIEAAVGPNPDDVAVVYRGEWAYGYFPTLWRYRDRMRQWVMTPDGAVQPIIHAAPVSRAAAGDPFASDRRLVMVDIATRGYRDLRPLLHGATASGTMPPAAPPSGFVVVSQQTLPGLYWTTITVAERRAS